MIIIDGWHLLRHLSGTIVTVLNPCIYCIRCSGDDWRDATRWNLRGKPNVPIVPRVPNVAGLIVWSKCDTASGAEAPPAGLTLLIEFSRQIISVWVRWAGDPQQNLSQNYAEHLTELRICPLNWFFTTSTLTRPEWLRTFADTSFELFNQRCEMWLKSMEVQYGVRVWSQWVQTEALSQYVYEPRLGFNCRIGTPGLLTVVTAVDVMSCEHNVAPQNLESQRFSGCRRVESLKY